MGVRIVGAVAAALGLFAAAGEAAAQAPGSHGVAARPGPARIGRPSGGNRAANPVWHRPGRGFAGRGFSGGLLAGGLYGPGYFGAGYGAGPTGVDASVRTYPSSDELVPAAWSYGTFGIPTVPGVRPPPKADPVVYVIDAPRRAKPSARVLSQSEDGWVAVDPQPMAGGARVVGVRVPR